MLKIDLSGKKAVVTASSRGIGKGIATVLSTSGAEVLIVSRNVDQLKKTAEEIMAKSGNKAFFIKADLTSRKDLSRLVNEAKDILGRVDIFVFNTGGPRPGRFIELEMDDWERAVQLLIYPAVFLTKAFVEDMKNRGWGRIIYSTSVAIKEPIEGLVLSNTVRISMAGLVRTLAREYAPYGVTVNGIMPGYIETERIQELAHEIAKKDGLEITEVIRNMSKDIPMGRMGRPEELGYLATFLASDYASYINGAMIPIDGGLLRSSL